MLLCTSFYAQGGVSVKNRIIAVLLCACGLFCLCGCVDTITQGNTSKPVSQYYFEDVCQAGGRFYFTTYTDDTRDMTVLLSDDSNIVQRELCRFPGSVHVDYVKKSYDSSGGTKMFFYVREDIGSCSIYSYSISDNSIKLFLQKDCSNMIPDTADSSVAWVIKDGKLLCVDMTTHNVIQERSYTAEQLGLSEIFPDGFFGKSGDCNVEISMEGSVIHFKASYGSRVDEMTVKEADIDTAPL